MGELQSLRAVECHKHYIVLIFIQAVDIRHKRHFLEEPAECCRFSPVRTVFLIGSRLADQLIDIFDSRRRILRVIPVQAFHISGLFNDLI